LLFKKTKRENAEEGIVLINVANSNSQGIVAIEHLDRIMEIVEQLVDVLKGFFAKFSETTYC